MMQLPPVATLDHTAALAVALAVAVADGSGPLVVDGSALDDYDTSTIALLMQARRLAAAAGRGVEFRGLPPQLLELARLYGVAELVESAAAAEAT